MIVGLFSFVLSLNLQEQLLFRPFYLHTALGYVFKQKKTKKKNMKFTTKHFKFFCFRLTQKINTTLILLLYILCLSLSFLLFFALKLIQFSHKNLNTQFCAWNAFCFSSYFVDLIWEKNDFFSFLENTSIPYAYILKSYAGSFCKFYFFTTRLLIVYKYCLYSRKDFVQCYFVFIRLRKVKTVAAIGKHKVVIFWCGMKIIYGNNKNNCRNWLINWNWIETGTNGSNNGI